MKWGLVLLGLLLRYVPHMFIIGFVWYSVHQLINVKDDPKTLISMGFIILSIVIIALLIVTRGLRRKCAELLRELVEGRYEKIGGPTLLMGTQEIDDEGKPYHVYVSVEQVEGEDWIFHQYHSKEKGRVVLEKIRVEEAEIKEFRNRISAARYKLRRRRPLLLRFFNGFSAPEEKYLFEVPPRGLASNFSFRHFEASVGRIEVLNAAE